MVTTPGIAFFISILAFNLTGDGLRRFLDDSHVNLSRLVNRYTVLASVALVLGLNVVLQGSSPLSVYRPEAEKFNVENVQRDIAALSSLEMEGRETGTPGAQKSADYIAQRMIEVGLLPAGEHGTYFLNLVNPRLHLTQLPSLEVLNGNGEPEASFAYRKDFAELAIQGSFGDVSAQVVGVAFGQKIGEVTDTDPFDMANSDARGRIVVIRAADLENIYAGAIDGILVIEDDFTSVQRKDVYPYQAPIRYVNRGLPMMVITAEVADELLKSAGSSLAELDQMDASVAPGQMAVTQPGPTVRMSIVVEMVEDLSSEMYTHVIGVYPGEGSVADLDNQVIIISAYYDGLGTGPDGTVYPGANDNASGVAMMLEMARILKKSAYRPDRTVLFVAWAGGERAERFSVKTITNARPGGGSLVVTEVIELSGVGYGSGDAIALSEESSFRLVRLYQSAADKLGVGTTTRGRNPHYGHPISFQFGERTALTLSLSWDGSDNLAHTTADTPEIIDPKKLYDTGSTTTLVLFILSRETDY